jgi:hypothetical protein
VDKLDKYKELLSLAQSNWSEFIVVADQIPADNLDYERLLGFLESGNSHVRNGARMLLMKRFSDKHLSTKGQEILALFLK